MARKQSKNMTKVVNETGETIQLVPVSAQGHRAPAITLESKGEYMIRSKPSETNRMLEVHDGNNNFTNVIITSDVLLKNSELTVIKPSPQADGAPPPAMYFGLVKVPRAHPQSR